MDAPLGSEDERTFWRADLPGAWVRPYLENAIYGKWNYPLGVTLYGILRTGQEIGDPHYTNYAADHIEQCTSLFAYSRWDQVQFGSPGVNHQLTLIDSLMTAVPSVQRCWKQVNFGRWMAQKRRLNT